MEIQVKQGSNEWFKARSKRVTASIAGALLGVDPNISKSNAIKILRGEYEQEDNFPILHGKRMERYARSDFEIETGLEVKECGFFSYEDWLGGSPDGLIGKDAILEIKCPISDKPLESVKTKPHYYAQLQINMMVTCRTKAYFYQWADDGRRVKHEIIHHDMKWISENIPKLFKIWNQVMTPVNENLEALVNNYKDLCNHIKELEVKKDFLLNDIVKYCGEQETIVGDHIICQATRKGAIDNKQMIADLLPEEDVEYYRKPDITFWTIK